VKDQIDAKGLTLLGEHYVYLGPNGSSEFGIDRVADEVAEQRPDMIINTLVGDGIEKLAVALKQRGISSEQCPVLAFAVTEVELAQLPPGLLQGGYTSWNYFQALDSANNDELITKFRERWPDIEAVNDGMISAYHSVMLWAQAVEEAGTHDVDAVRRQLRWQSIDSPGGIISIDSQTNHAWRVVHIGRFEDDATIRPIWTSGRPVRPMPYPISRTRGQWVTLVEGLYEQWGQWSNPVEKRGGEGRP
jgi:urea transport system substrate-binding protein